MFYNLNYSLERTIYKALRIEIAGYFLEQLEEDSFSGNHDYYNEQFGISNTKERMLAIGPGISYVTPTGLFIEAKVFFETFEGTRPTLRLAYRLTK
jgi:hypothetical protein